VSTTAAAGLDVMQARLGNGLRVVVSTDRSVPLVAVDVWYGVGSRDERSDRTGLAHLFEHLMFQGSAHVGPVEHMQLLQRVGGSVNGTTSFDRTTYYETVPSGALELAVWLEADRMGTLLSALTQENLDNQRDVVKNERRQRYDNVPYGTATERLFRLTFPEGHPYHHTPIGSMAHLDAASLDDCADFFRTYYAPNNAVVAIVGDVDAEQAVALVDQLCGDIPPHEVPAPRAGWFDAADGGARVEVDDPVPAAALRALVRVPPDGTHEHEAAHLVARILARGRSSRLTRRLVRHEEVAQSVTYSPYPLVGGVAAIGLDLRIRSGRTVAEAELALAEEVERLVEDGPTEDELLTAKAQSDRQWGSRLATRHGMADELARAVSLFGDVTRVAEAEARWHAVTAEEVRRAAGLFRADRAVSLVYRAPA
jgi:predicted Zn-dependent peptidase